MCMVPKRSCLIRDRGIVQERISRNNWTLRKKLLQDHLHSYWKSPCQCYNCTQCWENKWQSTSPTYNTRASNHTRVRQLIGSTICRNHPSRQTSRETFLVSRAMGRLKSSVRSLSWLLRLPLYPGKKNEYMIRDFIEEFFNADVNCWSSTSSETLSDQPSAFRNQGDLSGARSRTFKTKS